MDDVYVPPIGTRSTVCTVDDFSSVCVNWNNSSGLSVVYGEDIVKIVAD